MEKEALVSGIIYSLLYFRDKFFGIYLEAVTKLLCFENEETFGSTLNSAGGGINFA